MMVWILCPVHAEPVATGINMEPRSFELLPETVEEFACSACNGRHQWHKRSAWLVEGYVVRANAEQRSTRSSVRRRPALGATL